MASENSDSHSEGCQEFPWYKAGLFWKNLLNESINLLNVPRHGMVRHGMRSNEISIFGLEFESEDWKSLRGSTLVCICGNK